MEGGIQGLSHAAPEVTRACLATALHPQDHPFHLPLEPWSSASAWASEAAGLGSGSDSTT